MAADSVFEALSHPVRRRILALLKGGGKSAGEIAGAFSLAKPTLSGHFAKLRAADLIGAERQGTTIIYRLNMSVLEETVFSFMSLVGERNETQENS